MSVFPGRPSPKTKYEIVLLFDFTEFRTALFFHPFPRVKLSLPQRGKHDLMGKYLVLKKKK
jgi:hypothetical protein